jgi:hypothetical protein
MGGRAVDRPFLLCGRLLSHQLTKFELLRLILSEDGALRAGPVFHGPIRYTMGWAVGRPFPHPSTNFQLVTCSLYLISHICSSAPVIAFPDLGCGSQQPTDRLHHCICVGQLSILSPSKPSKIHRQVCARCSQA